MPSTWIVTILYVSIIFALALIVVWEYRRNRKSGSEPTDHAKD